MFCTNRKDSLKSYILSRFYKQRYAPIFYSISPDETVMSKYLDIDHNVSINNSTCVECDIEIEIGCRLDKNGNIILEVTGDTQALEKHVLTELQRYYTDFDPHN